MNFETDPEGVAIMRILNLGAGVQSTCVFLMSHEGLIEPIDHAIFGDTQEEPASVYQHLAWLRTVPAPVPIIHVGTAGKLGDHLLAGSIAAGGRKANKIGQDGSTRFASIPAFTATHHELRDLREACNEGIVRRQCTKEYKVEIVDRIIRRDIVGLKPRQRMPKSFSCTQLFGISWDERGRADRIRKRFDNNGRGSANWSTPAFPLIDLKMTRQDCKEWLKGRVPHETPRSACVFCPFKSASEWLKTKANPQEWARAVEVDRGIRAEGAAVNRGFNQALYLHRQCIPLEMVDLEAEAKKEADKRYVIRVARLWRRNVRSLNPTQKGQQS